MCPILLCLKSCLWAKKSIPYEERQEFIVGIIQSLSTHQGPMPSWAGCECLLTPLPRAPGKHLRAPIFALWRKGSLTRGAQISLLQLLQLLAPLHPAHLHRGCSRTTNCWELSQYIVHSPSPNLLLFGQTFLFCCFIEAVLYNSVFDLQPLVTGGCSRLSAQVMHVPDMQSSVGKVQSNPGQMPAGTHGPHDFS